MAMLALHLLQISLIYINRLMIQRILVDQGWLERVPAADLPSRRPLRRR